MYVSYIYSNKCGHSLRIENQCLTEQGRVGWDRIGCAVLCHDEDEDEGQGRVKECEMEME